MKTDRQLLFTHYGIPSNVCHMCTNCGKNDAMTDVATQARAAQDQIASKRIVRGQLTKNERAMCGMQVVNM